MRKCPGWTECFASFFFKEKYIHIHDVTPLICDGFILRSEQLEQQRALFHFLQIRRRRLRRENSEEEIRRRNLAKNKVAPHTHTMIHTQPHKHIHTAQFIPCAVDHIITAVFAQMALNVTRRMQQLIVNIMALKKESNNTAQL